MGVELNRKNDATIKRFRSLGHHRFTIPDELAHRKNEGKDLPDLVVKTFGYRSNPAPLGTIHFTKGLNRRQKHSLLGAVKAQLIRTNARMGLRFSANKIQAWGKQIIDQGLEPMFANRTMNRELYRVYRRLNVPSFQPSYS